MVKSRSKGKYWPPTNKPTTVPTGFPTSSPPTLPKARLALGLNHAVVIQDDGSVYGWGSDQYGQLTYATLAKQTIPVLLRGISAAIEVCAGIGFTCLVEQNMVKCVGVGGVLGDGTSVRRANFVVPVQTSASRVTCGANHACALSSSGGMACWGWDGYGQLGTNMSRTRALLPVAVVGYANAGVIQAAGGFHHTCIVIMLALRSALARTRGEKWEMELQL